MKRRAFLGAGVAGLGTLASSGSARPAAPDPARGCRLDQAVRFTTVVAGVGPLGAAVAARLARAPLPGLVPLAIPGPPPALGEMTTAHRDRLAHRLGAAGLVLVVGDAGMTAGPHLADWARANGTPVVGIVTTPPSVPAALLGRSANVPAFALAERVEPLIVISGVPAARPAGSPWPSGAERTSLVELAVRTARAIASVPSGQGPVCTDLADLRELFRGRVYATVGTAGGSGAGASRRAVSRAVHTLLDPTVLLNPGSMLIAIEGAGIREADVGDASRAASAVCRDETLLVTTGIPSRTSAGHIRATVIAAGGLGESLGLRLALGLPTAPLPPGVA